MSRPSAATAGPATSRDDVLQQLADQDIAVDDLLRDSGAGVDLLDALIEIAWDQPARTRAERVRRVREAHHEELEQRSTTARAVLEALLDRYAAHGLGEITSPAAVRVPPLSDLGTPRQLAQAMGAGGLHQAVDEVQAWIYSEPDVS